LIGKIWSFVFTFLLKVHAVVKGEEERMSGNFFYDFWMGFARNPRIGTYVFIVAERTLTAML
jgi:hypothetical protein